MKYKKLFIYLPIIIYMIMVCISVWFIQFDNEGAEYVEASIDNIRVAKYYFFTLPVCALIPSFVLFFLQNLPFKGNIIENNAFPTFPFDSISLNGMLGVLLNDSYPDVVEKLYEQKLINRKFRDGLLDTYKPFPDISFQTPRYQNPYNGIISIQCFFIQYKLEKMMVFLSEDKKNNNSYDELAKLFIKKTKCEPSYIYIKNPIVYWKDKDGTLSLDKTLGTITVQLTK